MNQIEKLTKIAQKVSAVFAVVIVGVVATQWLLNLLVSSFGLLITQPFEFLRYLIVGSWILYGLYYASAWFLESDSNTEGAVEE